MEYIRFNFDTKKLGLRESSIRIYPLVCMHLGAAQCDIKFLKKHLKRIKEDPNARWVYMGDGGECVTKFSKGGIYEQILNPQEQQDALIELLEPLREKGLFGIRGNHGNRIDKESGLSFDKSLCNALHIPYLGVSALANIIINRSSYDAFFHHGTDSGVEIQVKVSKAEGFKRFVDADALFTAHSHVAMDLPPAALISCDNGARKLRTKMRHQYICGCSYDSRTGYADEKGYPPILPAYIVVNFDGRIINGEAQKNQACHLFRSDGQHEVNGRD